MTTMERLAQLRDAEAAALAALPLTAAYEDVVDLIHRRVHEGSGKVVLSGMGKAGMIGQQLAITLASTGTPAISLHPAEAQHGDLGLLQPADVLVQISNSGRTRELLELSELAEALYPGLPRVVLTGQPEAPLARSANHVLLTGNPAEVCPLGLTPTTSTTAMKVVGDLLTVLLMERAGFTQADYARRHHSGYLGQKARGELDADAHPSGTDPEG